MKYRAELWVRLKVIDLVAQTAWMTLTEKLDFSSDLHGIVRYSYWGFDIDGDGGEKALEAVDRIIRIDSSFTNQNKHHYFLKLISDRTGEKAFTAGDLVLDKDFPIHEGAAVLKPGQSRYACDLLIRELGKDRDEGYLSRLDSRLEGVMVSAMKAGEVWRMIVSASDQEKAVKKVEDMAITRSRREGVLLNPHYQSSEFIGNTLEVA
ncbi:MAG: hypothetical protein JW814_09840 [Candidatus Krumholzibacteriota bacterium]|nr:hypothetical protein [Candidatus Krumholzibacteriota bacterium]